MNNNSRRHGLSKSRITAFEQCPKRLWLSVHRRDEATYDEGALVQFQAGHQVGELACALWPAGVMVEAEPDLGAALTTTAQLVADGHPGPIFEATFQHEGVLIRADILSRDGAGGWRLAEVKSSTRPKDYHRGDLATQVWVLEAAGVPVSGAAIRHLNRDFVLTREGDYVGLFRDAELLDDITDIAADRLALAAEARVVLAGEEPVRAVGDHCSSPFNCEFAAYCGRNLPPGPDWPVTLLPHGAGRKWLEQGIDDLLALEDTQLTGRNARILAATRTGEPYHDAEGARAAMTRWNYPRAWLDFETIAFAVPRWIGTRPYQQIPFQFSLHLEAADGTITHHEFLHTEGSDPRMACAEALIQSIPANATIIAYNAPFERRVLLDLARDDLQYADALGSMVARTVDLLPVTREHWYHRDQRGSWSIKAVLPTMTDLGYDGLEVKDGGMAQEAYLEAIDPATSEGRRWVLQEGLRAYCERDTWAMVELARKLGGAAGDDGADDPCPRTPAA